MTHHVILGAGPAGVIAAETIRKHAPDDRITLVGDEPEAPYSRMAIPYLLIGNIDERGTWLRKGATHYADLRIEACVARRTRSMPSGRKVMLDNGESSASTRLLIATGSHPCARRYPASIRPGCTVLDAGRCARDHGLATGRAGAADGRRLHRLHHHGGAGRARRATERGGDGRPHGAAHDGPHRRRHDQGLVRSQGREVFTGTRVEAIEPGSTAEGASVERPDAWRPTW